MTMAAADVPLDGLKVLLAEDNVTNQLVASQMLRRLGAEVEIVFSAPETQSERTC